MPEPADARLRPTAMKRALVLSVLALVLATGCGSADEASDPASERTPSTPAKTAGCQQSIERIARADLDGDGTQETLVVATGGGADCPDMLELEGRTGDPIVGAELPPGEPPVTSAFAVAVPGRSGELVVTRQVHPRGGFQTRVFALAGDEFAQLEVDGRPLVPFVATDVQEHPVSIDCGDNLIVVTEAVAHEPPGVMFAWDIKRTTYALQGVAVTPGPTTEIADNVLPEMLKQRFPELGKNAVFPSCRVGR